ncbi:MAG: hypothetical protein ACTSW1_07280 [Candidatus Hodarchaeales archaeon]
MKNIKEGDKLKVGGYGNWSRFKIKKIVARGSDWIALYDETGRYRVICEYEIVSIGKG